jgi:hypothetical protein
VRSACSSCGRDVDLAAPADGGEVICETCRAEGQAKPAAPERLDPARADKGGTASGGRARKLERASFWLGDDELAEHARPAAPAAEPASAQHRAGDSSIEDLKRLASPSSRPPARHVDDLFGLRAEYFGQDRSRLEPPVLAPPTAEALAGSAKLAPTVDLLRAPAPAEPEAADTRAAPGASRHRGLAGVAVGVLLGAVLALGAARLMRPPADDGKTAASAPARAGGSTEPAATRTAEPATTEAPATPQVKALTPGAKVADDEPPAKAAKDEPAEARAARDAPTGGGAPAKEAAAAGKEAAGAREPPGAKDAHAAKEAPSSAPAEPAKPSEADALLAAQRAAIANPQGTQGAAFSRSAAGAALAAIAGQAAGCKKDGDPSGIAKVSITFAPSGRVTNSQVVSGPYIGSAAGGCIARAFRGAKVPPFDGDPVTVQKAVDLR